MPCTVAAQWVISVIVTMVTGAVIVTGGAAVAAVGVQGRLVWPWQPRHLGRAVAVTAAVWAVTGVVMVGVGRCV